MGVVLSAGGAFAWYRDEFARDLAHSADASSLLNEEASTVAPGADGVIFLPYLQGERTPHRDAAARGAFLGLTLAHTRAHLTRAVLEGIAFALRDSLTLLQSLGLAPSELLLTGGGARSTFVRQLQADVYGIPVAVVNREEGPAYGAAMLAAVGAGAYPNVESAARATIERRVSERPDAVRHHAYDAAYARFRGAFRAARPELLTG
jgi:xylulokinase